jgi:hypothetical protein
VKVFKIFLMVCKKKKKVPKGIVAKTIHRGKFNKLVER